MENIKINGCYNCPFKITDWDDFAVGKDTHEKCSLAIFKGEPEYIILVHNLGDEEELITPEWCPMRTKDVLVEYEHR